MNRTGLSLICPSSTLVQGVGGKWNGSEKGNSGGKGSANQVIAKIYTWEITHKICMCREF